VFENNLLEPKQIYRKEDVALGLVMRYAEGRSSILRLIDTLIEETQSGQKFQKKSRELFRMEAGAVTYHGLAGVNALEGERALLLDNDGLLIVMVFHFPSTLGFLSKV